MSAAYLRSVVLTKSSISSGSRSALWGTSSGDLPKHIHWYGINFFWPGVKAATGTMPAIGVEFFDGSSSTFALVRSPVNLSKCFSVSSFSMQSAPSKPSFPFRKITVS